MARDHWTHREVLHTMKYILPVVGLTLFLLSFAPQGAVHAADLSVALDGKDVAVLLKGDFE